MSNISSATTGWLRTGRSGAGRASRRESLGTLAVSGRLILDEQSRAVEIWDELGAPGLKPGREVIVRCLRRDRNLIGEPSAVMFRRAAGLRGFDPAWRQLIDQEMWFHLLSAGDLAYDPEPLCAFRQHGAPADGRETAIRTSRRWKAS